MMANMKNLVLLLVSSISVQASVMDDLHALEKEIKALTLFERSDTSWQAPAECEYILAFDCGSSGTGMLLLSDKEQCQVPTGKLVATEDIKKETQHFEWAGTLDGVELSNGGGKKFTPTMMKVLRLQAVEEDTTKLGWESVMKGVATIVTTLFTQNQIKITGAVFAGTAGNRIIEQQPCEEGDCPWNNDAFAWKNVKDAWKANDDLKEIEVKFGINNNDIGTLPGSDEAKSEWFAAGKKAIVSMGGSSAQIAFPYPEKKEQIPTCPDGRKAAVEKIQNLLEAAVDPEDATNKFLCGTETRATDFITMDDQGWVFMSFLANNRAEECRDKRGVPPPQKAPTFSVADQGQFFFHMIGGQDETMANVNANSGFLAWSQQFESNPAADKKLAEQCGACRDSDSSKNCSNPGGPVKETNAWKCMQCMKAYANWDLEFAALKSMFSDQQCHQPKGRFQAAAQVYGHFDRAKDGQLLQSGFSIQDKKFCFEDECFDPMVAYKATENAVFTMKGKCMTDDVATKYGGSFGPLYSIALWEGLGLTDYVFDIDNGVEVGEGVAQQAFDNEDLSFSKYGAELKKIIG